MKTESAVALIILLILLIFTPLIFSLANVSFTVAKHVFDTTAVMIIIGFLVITFLLLYYKNI